MRQWTRITIVCAHCRKRFRARKADVTYRRKQGATRFFCNMKCAGLARRTNLTLAEGRAVKRQYDIDYRHLNRERLKAEKAAYFRRTYDPVAAKAPRKKRMRYHVLYCRKYYADPKHKAAKVEYDQSRRSAKYGEFADAHRALVVLKQTICKQVPDKYQRAIMRGYYERSAQQRRRDAQISRH